MIRLINVLAFIAILAAVTLAQLAASDEDALRMIVGKYFDAFARKDWAAMESIWHKNSPGKGQRFEVFPRQFAESELSFSTPTISRFNAENLAISLRVATRRTVKVGNSINVTDIRIEMAFIKENGEWKLWSDLSPLTALLNALTDAKTDEVRRRLVDQDSDLVTRELLFLIAGQSDRAYAQGDQAKSLNLLLSQVLVAERLNNRNELSDAWHKVGIIHFLQKRFEDALTAYRRSLTIDEESGRKEETARSLSSIALVFLAQSKFDESIEYFQRALALYESLNLKQEIVRAVENIGNVHNEKGDSTAAIEFYQRCVQLYDESKRADNAAHMVLKIARVEYEQGHDGAAINYFRQAADRFAASENRRTLGYAFHNIANIYYEQGDYNAALMFYQRSLQAERQAGTREGEAGALQGVGLIHSLNVNYAAALEAYRQNLSVVQSLRKKDDIAVAWQKVGGMLFSLNKFDEALSAYNEVLALREQLGDGQDTALALLDVGLTLAAKRQYSEALEQYFKSRELYDKAGNVAGVAAALLNIAQVHFVQSNFAQSLEQANAAADFAKRAKDEDLFWQARYRAGKSHFRLSDMSSARTALTEAINVIETMKPQASRGNQQPKFFETKIAPYLAMVDVAIGEGKGKDAYNFSQRAKIRVLTGLTQGIRTQVTKTLSPREQERERQLLAAITQFNLMSYRESERDKPNPTRVAELRARLQKAQSDYSTYLKQLYSLHPALKILRGEIKPAIVEQAAALVRDTKTALLEFVETDERVYLFVFSKESANGKTPRATVPTTLKIFVLDTTRGDLYARLQKFNQSIVGREDAVNVQARELYDLLLKTAQELLIGKTQLLIAPDAISWALPFQALRTEADHFLIEDYAINYTPSATALSAMASVRLTPTPIRPGQSISLLAAINPALGPDATERVKTALTVSQIDPTTGGEKEFAEFGKQYPSKQSLILIGSDATEDKVKSEIGKARVIHFAVQGIHHEASPLFSLLALSPNFDSATAGDGLVELRELFQMNLRADLAVMESTEWAQPKTLTNRTMIAWDWAWFVAGGKSLLLSQWRSDSSDLMIEFHRQIKTTGKSKAAAWREVVRQFIAREEFKHPYFWAGFTLLGR